MTTDAAHTAGATSRTRILQVLALAAGFLVVLAFAMVGAWPVTVLLGLPLLAAAVLAARHPRAAAVLALVPALAVSVWWVVYHAREGWALDDPWSETWWLAAGPVAAATVVVAALVAAPGSRNRFSGE
ncbi:hypothetical protein ACI8AF_09985 [Blastococcus sp. SYSU D00669]